MNDKPMTGFFASLTDEQKASALAYRGPENHGPAMSDEKLKPTEPVDENGFCLRCISRADCRFYKNCYIDNHPTGEAFHRTPAKPEGHQP